jgi:hypothetical protein
MARIIQIIEADDSNYVSDEWHCVCAYPYPRTACGYQLEGEDGVVASPEIEGHVTCGTCQRVIEDMQSVRNWKPRPTKDAPDQKRAGSKSNRLSTPAVFGG